MTSSFFGICKVELKDSLQPNGGKGVFASKDINEINTPLCYYDGYFKSEKANLSDIEQQYCIQYEGRKVIGFPIIRNVNFGLGQFMNDGMLPILGDIQEVIFSLVPLERIKLIVMAFLAYSIHSNNKANVSWKQHDKKKAIIMYNTKPIKQGEECYVHYGVGYWISHYYRHFLSTSSMEMVGYLHTSKCWLIGKLADSTYSMQQDKEKTKEILEKAGGGKRGLEILIQTMYMALLNCLRLNQLDIKDNLPPNWEVEERNYIELIKQKKIIVRYYVYCNAESGELAQQLTSFFS